MQNKIVIGDYTFEDDKILSGNATFEHSMIGETLSIDTFTFGVIAESGEPLEDADEELIITADSEQFECISYDMFDSIEYGTPVFFYQNDALWGKFFINTVARTGKNTYSVECFSLIGLLANSRHYGGMYTGQLASVVLADILSGITYTLDASLASVTVRGYLPIASKRDNLQQVLFVINAAVKIGTDGSMQIVPMQQNTVSQIDGARVYRGGSVEVGDVVDGVQLTEHNYFISSETVTLFDDSITGTELITFNEPYHTLSITGGTIVASGVNFAKVSPPSGQVAAAITLTGKKYTHVTRVVSAGTTTVTGSENVKTVTGAYLANPEIADELCERVYDYLSCNVRIRESIIMGDERPADIVEVYNPYTEEYVQACMESMSVTLSGVNKGDCEFLVGFEPEGVVSGFQHYAMLTGDGTWAKSGNNMTLTQTSGSWVIDGQTVSGTQNLGDISKIRIILVGGGNGGNGGYAGSAGGNGSWTYTGTYYYGVNNTLTGGGGGVGGSGGTAGNGGGIFELSLNISNNENGNMTIGAGGTGGAVGASGTAGAATTFTKGGVPYSSANGKTYSYGYTEAKSTLTFGNKGVDGVSGADGGDASGSTGLSGGNVGNYVGGTGLGMRSFSVSYWPTADSQSGTAGPAGGGGASALANGNSASTAQRGVGGAGANGGSGANATNYGAGGGGANGGGGGGGSTGYYYHGYWRSDRTNGYMFANSNGGAGGSGGTGGNGKQGCVVIYY